MKAVKITRIVFIVCLLAQIALFFTPWFSFNMKEAGFYSGFRAIPLFVIPYAYMFWYLWQDCYAWQERPRGGFALLMELALVWVLLGLVKVVFTWTDAMLISKTIDLSLSLRLAHLPFFLVCGLALANTLVFQVFLILETAKSRRGTPGPAPEAA